jgi:hypothetical protein
MTTNYDGLTRNIWPGTWSPTDDNPIVLDTEVRGTLQGISGAVGDRLTNIPGKRLAEGMLVYLKNGYEADGYTRVGDTYYTYRLMAGQSRNLATGALPNIESNWNVVSFSGGGTSSGIIKTFNILNEFTAPLMGKAIYVPVTSDIVRSVQMTNGQAVGTDLMMGLYRNNELLNFFTLSAGRYTANYSGLAHRITPNDYLSVNAVSGSGMNFSMALLNIDI